MLKTLRKRLNRKDEGFTLIELMVVVLIIAILLAIAIPTFLGARSRAQNRASESNLRNALTAEKTVYTDNQLYVSATSVASAEPSLTFQTTTPAQGTNQVQVTLPTTDTTGNEVCLEAISASGSKYMILDVATAGTNYAATGTYYGSGSSVACPTASAPTSSANNTWGTTPSAGGW